MARPNRRSGNLPAEATSFVGRRRELAELRKKLNVSCLVSLVGPGGVGKTRLAVRIATDHARGFADGAWLVELADVQDSALVPHAVISALDPRHQAATEPLRHLSSHLNDKQLLLVVDNCEHVLGAAAEVVAEVIGAAPRRRAIATRREPLSGFDRARRSQNASAVCGADPHRLNDRFSLLTGETGMLCLVIKRSEQQSNGALSCWALTSARSCPGCVSSQAVSPWRTSSRFVSPLTFPRPIHCAGRQVAGNERGPERCRLLSLTRDDARICPSRVAARAQDPEQARAQVMGPGRHLDSLVMTAAAVTRTSTLVRSRPLNARNVWGAAPGATSADRSSAGDGRTSCIRGRGPPPSPCAHRRGRLRQARKTAVLAPAAIDTLMTDSLLEARK